MSEVGSTHTSDPAEQSAAPGLSVHVAIPNGDEIFARYGALVLGLELAVDLQRAHKTLIVPGFVVFDLGSRTIVRAHGRRPVGSWSQGAVLKVSGVVEGFTHSASRGRNSSLHQPKLPPDATLSPERLTEVLREIVSNTPILSKDVRALVVQEFVDVSSECHVTIHCDEDICTIEVNYRNSLHLFDLDRSGAVVHVEACGPQRDLGLVQSRIPLSDWTQLHFKMKDELGFDLNTEGYPSSQGDFQVMQLRPIPHDYEYVQEARNLSRSDVLWSTRFVWGVFDVTDHIASRMSDPLSTIVAPDRGLDVVTSDGTLPPLWRHALYTRSLAHFDTVLLVDSRLGFHLNHSLDLLPPYGESRQRFRTIHVPSSTLSKLGRKRTRMISDGFVGHVFCVDETEKSALPK